MKKLTVLIAMLMATSVWGEGLTLACTGVTEIPDNKLATTTIRPSNSSPTTGNTVVQGRKNIGAVVNFFMNDNQTDGWVQLPASMRLQSEVGKKISLN